MPREGCCTLKGIGTQAAQFLSPNMAGIAFESTEEENWGYNSVVKNEEEFLNRYQDITGAIKDMSFVCGYCYTQLTDVEQEVNGLADANRNLKAAKKKILKINQD